MSTGPNSTKTNYILCHNNPCILHTRLGISLCTTGSTWWNTWKIYVTRNLYNVWCFLLTLMQIVACIAAAVLKNSFLQAHLPLFSANYIILHYLYYIFTNAMKLMWIFGKIPIFWLSISFASINYSMTVIFRSF